MMFQKIVKRNIRKTPKFRLIMYSISSSSLVTKHQFTNNMFTIYPYTNRENPVEWKPIKIKIFKRLHVNITFLNGRTLRTGPEVYNSLMLFTETIFNESQTSGTKVQNLE